MKTIYPLNNFHLLNCYVCKRNRRNHLRHINVLKYYLPDILEEIAILFTLQDLHFKLMFIIPRANCINVTVLTFVISLDSIWITTLLVFSSTSTVIHSTEVD